MKLATSLSDAFTVYMPGRRGRGLSGPPGDSYNLGKESQDIEALAAKTGAQNIFALSSGALISLQAALTIPAIRKAAIYEPPLSINHSSPVAWAARFDREISEGTLAYALVTVLKALHASPVFSAVPRFLLVPFIKLAIEVEARAVKDGDISLKALIPTMHFDAQLVIENRWRAGRF
jgi:pimeloyl-ACP methyl ester carboxylesterase